MIVSAARWRSMKTAPRDGTPILLRVNFNDRLGEDAIVAAYDNMAGPLDSGHGRFVWLPTLAADGASRIAERVPTGWLPLPLLKRKKKVKRDEEE